MKTPKEIQQEIDQINKELDSDLKKSYEAKGKFTPNKRVKLENRINFLKTLILFLDSKPSPEYIKCEVFRIKKSIEQANSQYNYWEKHNAPKMLTLKNTNQCIARLPDWEN